jgi:cell division transport system ATP-binding protein
VEFQIILYHNVPVYQKDVTVLSDVSLGVARGEFVYLIGKTGSGKSSLLKTIYAELPVRMGTASVAGFNLLKIRRREIPSLRRKLGIVFQDFQLLTDRTVYENLYFVLRSTGWKNRAEMKARVEEVLKKVGLDGTGEKMPHQLSGGEQQRVAIARALLNNPEIILADEPTGNLDPETSRSIMRLLVDISKAGKAVLMATHNYTLLQEFPSRTLKCEDGRIVALP